MLFKNMLFKNMLTTTHMRKASYLMKKEDSRDQIVAVKDTIDENELVQISLNGFSTLWHNFF